MADEVFAVAGEEVDDGDFNHRVGSGGETHGGACDTDKELCGERGVVDGHVEFETLVLGLAGNAFANHVDTVAHILDIINALN